jgi:hypothetical protein
LDTTSMAPGGPTTGFESVPFIFRGSKKATGHDNGPDQ